MGARLADVIVQIQNVRQLGSVVTAMRGIAASRAQKGRSLLDGVESYTDVVSHAIGAALNLLPPDLAAPPSNRTKRGLIVFCAEQGFAGAFSERVIDLAANDLADATILMIGTRGMTLATERGIDVSWSTPMATNVEAVPSLADRITEALYGYVASGAVDHVDVLCSRTTPNGGIVVDRHSLMPIDFHRFPQQTSRQRPITTLRPLLLLERLAAEYVYAQVCDAAMHAFESENQARIMAMASAKGNIDEKLELLSARERHLRQEEITTEIVELAAGAEASLNKRL